MSGRKFSKVSPALWRSGRFATLPTKEAKLLYLYFLTSEHQTSAGAFRIPDGYACEDLGWERKDYHEARQCLIDGEMIVFDADTEEVFVLRWFKHNPPTNPKHRAGTERLISEIDSDAIREIAEAEYDELCTTSEPENPRGNSLPTVSPELQSRLGRGDR